MRIGTIIKKLRGNMTQDELASKSGVNFTTISKIEKGLLTGTLTTHLKIAKGLGITLPELYRDFDKPEPPPFEVNKTLASHPDIFTYDDKAVSQILVKHYLKRRMFPELLRLEEGGTTHLEQKPPGTEQFIFVLDGNIEIRIGETGQGLKKGQSIYFDASRTHIIKNIAKTPAKCLRITSPGAL